MVGFRVCVASRPPGKGKGRSLKLAALSGRSEQARDWNEATLQEALIAPRSVDWPQLSSYPRLAPLCWASGSWSRVLLGGFQLSSNRGQYPIRCSSEDQQLRHDKMIKCQSIIGWKPCPWCSWLLANCDRCLCVISYGPMTEEYSGCGQRKWGPLEIGAPFVDATIKK